MKKKKIEGAVRNLNCSMFNYTRSCLRYCCFWSSRKRKTIWNKIVTSSSSNVDDSDDYSSEDDNDYNYSSSSSSNYSSSSSSEIFDPNNYEVPDFATWNHDQLEHDKKIQITGTVVQ